MLVTPRSLFRAALAGALSLVAAGATLAQDAASSRENAKPVSVVEGIVSQIESLPTPGSKPILRLVDGLVPVDTTNAKVQDLYGGALGLDAIHVGTRVIVTATASATATATAPLAAQLIVVASAANEGVLTGLVEAVDVGAGTFRVLGLTVRTNASTRWVGGGVIPASGAATAGGVTGLADLEVGDQVVALVRAESGALVARHVVVVPSAPATDTVHLSGTVKAIGTASWTVTVDGKDVVLVVTDRTRVTGSPAPGDTVEVLAQRDAAGVLTAVVIAKVDVAPPPAPAVVRVQGKVKAIATAAWIVTTASGDRTLGITGDTRIIGSPVVGDQVEALALQAPSGALTAVTIAKVAVPVPVVTSFEGTVKTITEGLWTVDSVRVLVTRLTVVTGSPRVGDRVKVTGTRMSASGSPAAGGDFVATAIDKL